MTPQKAEQMRLNKFIRMVVAEVAVMAMPELTKPYESRYYVAVRRGDVLSDVSGENKVDKIAMTKYFPPETMREYRENFREVAKLIADTAARRGECEFMIRRVKSGKVKIVVYGDAK